VGKCVCIEPYDTNANCQDLMFGSGASQSWNEAESHFRSHESELLFV
jgi:hypothetical protein